MPTTIYDSSKLTQRRADKAVAGQFFRNMNNSTRVFYPILGIADNSNVTNARLGQMKDITKCDGGYSVDYGCPCPNTTA
jgi:hypothetical protein